MNRRAFLLTLAWTAPLRSRLGAQERIESLTAGPTPRIALNHVGFLPKARKVVIVRGGGESAPAEFTVRDIGSSRFGWYGMPPKPMQLTRPLRKTACDFGECLTGDFTELEREGMYQVTIPGERSVPFFIRPDAWRRTLPKAVGYIHAQRCGTDVPDVHPVCHLDDARRRDSGEHLDVTGGWHDAGDLRKWMSATMTSGFALLELAAAGPPAGLQRDNLLDEFRWGNRYFLKMQDADGLVFNDAAGGVNGDNSDNHWTDNKVGTEDDRYINPSKPGRIQAMFTTLQAMAAQAFRESDAAYADVCLAAARRCWDASKRGAGTGDLAWWTRAAIAGGWSAEAAQLGRQLLALQNTGFTGSQKLVRGFWRTSPSDPSPYVDAVYSAYPVLALLHLLSAFPDHEDAGRWRDAVRLYVDEYVLPMTARNAYRIVPLGLFIGSPTPEHYRPLEGELTYRYFLPVRKQSWWLGTTSHLEGHAVLLAGAAHLFKETGYRDLAYRQLEWVIGANPFGASLMTGEGMRNPYPHSRYVGLIPGGIMNGIAGNTRDEPVLDMEYGYDWRTTEYWSPHNAHYIWALAVLEA
ncbi:MAG: glycoside hydrolase family 9 protein [Acidobacteriota bacterium]